LFKHTWITHAVRDLVVTITCSSTNLPNL